ncbi:MAG: sulfatase [Bryobacterales bacterium]|nr:sulfatase [Bryobacterales bacterium]
MTRRSFLFAPLPLAAQRQRRTNVLFITADDLGLYLGCYGEKRIATPHLDKFAAEGVRFRTAYVAQASCSPSRSAMFTGLMPHANGQYGLANGGFKLHEELRGATIPNLLKRAGYRTGIIGKLHVEPEDSFRWDYRQKGNETRRVRTVAPQAEAFLKQDGPFFLMVNFSDPHAFAKGQPREWYFPPEVEGIPEKPLAPSAETVFDWQRVDNTAQRERTANYLNAVQRFDTGVGLLLAALERTGKAGDTLVIIIGDHGAPFARGKTTVYESGLRVPFLVRWPGVSRPHVSDKFVSTVDILPTILDAAGVGLPPHKLHGTSLRGVVRDPRAKWREYLAAEFHFHGAKPFYPRRAIRDSRYKLIHNLLAGSAKPSTGIDGDTAFPRSATDAPADARQAFQTFANPPEYELYDLDADPVEFRNLAGDPGHAAALRRLQGALLAWRKKTQDPALDPSFLEKMAARQPA